MDERAIDADTGRGMMGDEYHVKPELIEQLKRHSLQSFRNGAAPDLILHPPTLTAEQRETLRHARGAK